MFRRLALLSTALVARAAYPAHAQTAGLDRLPSHFAQYQAARIHYKSTGAGSSAVVFIHGWAGALEVWNAQLPVVEGKRHALFIDRPGFGRSDKPNVAYTMDHLAAAIDAVVRDAGVDRAVLVGHRTQIGAFAGRFEGSDYEKNIGAMFDGMLATMTDTASRAFVRRTAVSTPKHAAVSSMREQLNPAIWGDDPIKVSMLAVMAPNPGWNDDYVAYVKRIAPGIRYEVIPGSGHFVMVEHASEFNALLADFLKVL